METVSFVKAMMNFFGKKNGQTLVEFKDELRALNAQDRQFFKDEFAKIGVIVEETPVNPTA